MTRALGLALILTLLTGCSLWGPRSVDFVTDPIVLDGVSTMTLTLTNRSPFGTSFSVDDDTDWLQAVPPAGELGGYRSVEVLLVVDKSHVPASSWRPLERWPDTYAAAVAVRAGDVDNTVDLTFRVAPEPTVNACTTPTVTAAGVQRTPSVPAVGGAPSWSVNEVDGARYAIVRYADPPDLAPAYVPGTSLGSFADDIATAYGLLERRPGPGARVEVARIPGGVDPDGFVQRLAADPRVAYAELDRPLYPQAVTTDDPALGGQWGPCRFGLPEAWEASTGTALSGSDAPKATIAVLDSGVDLDHPDLRTRILPGRDFCPVADAAVTPCSSVASEPGGEAVGDGHGTHVAGIAAAIGDNGTGIAGVAWGGTRLLPVKVFDDAGDVTSISALACAIHWAYGSTDPASLCGAPANAHPAAILNLSLGGTGTSRTLDDAIAAATRAGALVFASAGNTSGAGAHQGILMPANGPDAIAVGSVNSNFERSSFSRFDARGGRTVDLMAPGGYLLASGSSIYSTYFGGSSSSLPCSTYCSLAGTSMATPFAAGVAALVWSHQPELTAAQVRARLAAKTYFAPTWDRHEYGAGVVCADAAVGRPTTCGTVP